MNQMSVMLCFKCKKKKKSEKERERNLKLPESDAVARRK